jgi:hypothetical protein
MADLMADVRISGSVSRRPIAVAGLGAGGPEQVAIPVPRDTGVGW